MVSCSKTGILLPVVPLISCGVLVVLGFIGGLWIIGVECLSTNLDPVVQN